MKGCRSVVLGEKARLDYKGKRNIELGVTEGEEESSERHQRVNELTTGRGEAPGHTQVT